MQHTKTITLADGRELVIDLNKMTMPEWKALFDPKQPDADESSTLAKVAGMPLAEFELLGFADSKKLATAIVQFAVAYSKDLHENPT
jgi:hypothetical protein